MIHGLELCAGTATVGLSALAGHFVEPLIGYMGSKRRWAADLAAACLGRIDALTLVDAGPWGQTWATLVKPGQAALVGAELRALDAEGQLPEVWERLVRQAPDADPVRRAAQFLCLQGRTASNIPIWWEPSQSRWVAPTGSRIQVAGQRTRKGRRAPCAVDAAIACHGSREVSTANPKRVTSSGMIRIATLARRVESLALLPLDRIEVIQADVRTVAPRQRSRVFFDPPYEGCPRYAAELSRDDVLAVAMAHAAVAERVTVCEAEPLPLEGWRMWQIARREWITTVGIEHHPWKQLQLPSIGWAS